jgi:hypothetical protein
MNNVLKVPDIFALTNETPVEVTCYYAKSGYKGAPPHTPERISLWFPPLDKQTPGMREALAGRWEALMSNLSEVPVDIHGTRITHPSGNLDGALASEYQARKAVVNAARAQIGLPAVY